MRALIRLFLQMLWLASLALPAKAGEPPAIAVVVASHSSHEVLDKNALKRIFLGETRAWSNQESIRPVNLAASHPLRRAFSMRVLGLEPEELDEYWNNQYFNGIFPPYAAASEEAVLRFVAESPDAVGYVSACAVDARVKALAFVTASGWVKGGDAAKFCGSSASSRF
jgi:ABC-type phosphate transport system substrate-binding protein